MAIEGVGGLLTRIAFGVRVHWMHPFGGLRLSHGHKISDALTRGQAIALVMDWIHRATHSRIKPLVDFGKNLRGYVQGIIAAADFKINTSVLEGVNNKIKQIKRRAYGFRDDQYFFLKVKAAFHGLPR